MKTNPNDVVTYNENINFGRGLTKREYFAALLMQGMLANSANVTDARGFAFSAAVYADALIEALNKED
jgi:hypothetical protein